MVKNGFGTVLILVLVGIVGIAAVVAFGIFDLGKLKKANESIPVQDPVVEELKVLGTSDEVDDIERYLNQTNLDKIDSEMSEVEKSVEGL
jgi:hypothetical protein